MGFESQYTHNDNSQTYRKRDPSFNSNNKCWMKSRQNRWKSDQQVKRIIIQVCGCKTFFCFPSAVFFVFIFLCQPRGRSIIQWLTKHFRRAKFQTTSFVSGKSSVVKNFHSTFTPPLEVKHALPLPPPSPYPSHTHRLTQSLPPSPSLTSPPSPSLTLLPLSLTHHFTPSLPHPCSPYLNTNLSPSHTHLLPTSTQTSLPSSPTISFPPPTPCITDTPDLPAVLKASRLCWLCNSRAPIHSLV
jgi:hypothetical protein